MPSKEGGHSGDNVKVCVRCRPLNDKERSQGFKQIVQVDKLRGTVSVTNKEATAGEPPKVFTFDHVYPLDTKQVDLYNETARPLVESVLEGYNGTIFAYGQTGTGKTFTMEGVRTTPELKGIIPNSFAHIFGYIAKKEGDIKFLVRVQYLEIYNEDVRDLLGKDQSSRLEVKERPDVGVYVKDLTAFVVHNADEMDKIMSMGNKNRSVGATNMNEHSSRSHAIFSVTIECNEKMADNEWHLRMGKLHLVDLAGSERQSKTGASGQRLKEATKINLSLSTLGNVISALVDGKSTHIPYRNSKLTRLLQDSLGGNSKTVMMANIGPADYNYDETVSTLRWANRAKNIKNKAKINEDPKDALLRQFQAEIEALRRRLEEAGGGEGESTSSGESEEEVEEGGVMVRRRKHHKRVSITAEKMQEMQQKIEEERKALASQKDLAEGEKERIAEDLMKREQDLQQAKSQRDELVGKMQAIEKKIIVGGENLLEKAQEQERLLEESAKELEETRNKEEALRAKLQEKEQERLDIEEKYSSLQDEASGKTRKLKKVWTMLMAARSEVGDLQQEHQREMEGLLENVRQLSRELRLQMVIIDQYVPPDYQQMIEQYAHWNDEIGEWQLKCVAYTGNNMRKVPAAGHHADTEHIEFHGPDLSHLYLAYTAEGEMLKMKDGRGEKLARRHKRKGGRQAGANQTLNIDALLQ